MTKQMTLYTRTSGNLKQNTAFLRYPVSIPTRRRKKRYRLKEDKGRFKASVEDVKGEVTCSRLPNTHDAKILHVFETKARPNRKGRWVAEVGSGQEILDGLHVNRDFNQREADRVWDALENWKAVSILFDGTYHVKGKKRTIKKLFGVIDAMKYWQDEAGWWNFKVTFNDDYINEILNNQSVFLHVPTYMRLKSDFACQLFGWLTAMLGYQSQTFPIRLKIIMGQLGLKKSPTLRHELECIDRIIDAVEEINYTLPKYGRLYTVRVKKMNGERRLIFAKHIRRRHLIAAE